MAQGDVTFFDQALVDVMEKLHDLESDDLRVALLTNAVTPTAADADPRYGAGGGTNYATSEVAAGGNYVAGGAAIANPAVTLTGGLAMFDGDDVSWAQHASNPTNATWGLIYNNTDAGKRALGFVDLGGAFNMTTGPLSIAWNANGLARLNQA